jgi:hypothetical protein
LETKDLTRFSKALLSSIMRRRQPRHTMPISAPVLKTCHWSLPQGCFFFRITMSPGFISITISGFYPVAVYKIAQFHGGMTGGGSKIISARGIYDLSRGAYNHISAVGIRPVADCLLKIAALSTDAWNQQQHVRMYFAYELQLFRVRGPGYQSDIAVSVPRAGFIGNYFEKRHMPVVGGTDQRL